MAFLQARPSLGLRPYIMSYWAYQGQADRLLEDYTYPDGCQEVIFNIDTCVLKQDARGSLFKNPAIEVVGQLTKPYRVSAQGNQLYFGVRFHPHGFSAFSPASVGEFNNQNIDARDIFSDDIQCLLDHCQSLYAFSHFVQQADRYFIQKSLDAKMKKESYGLVKACIQTLQAVRQEFSISDLCEHYSVSPRWLQIQFKNHVGVSPKTLQKIFRFNSGVYLLSRDVMKLSSIAAECGYYDQAHFNREFKALSGVTPKVYQERAHPINKHFLCGGKGRFDF